MRSFCDYPIEPSRSFHVIISGLLVLVQPSRNQNTPLAASLAVRDTPTTSVISLFVCIMPIYRCFPLTLRVRECHANICHFPHVSSLYVYDRHCEVVHYQDWNRVKTMRPSTNLLPGVMRIQPSSSVPASQRLSNLSSGVVVAQHEEDTIQPTAKRGLPFDEESKLVYGVIFSLRNMVKKLAGRFVLLQFMLHY